MAPTTNPTNASDADHDGRRRLRPAHGEEPGGDRAPGRPGPATAGCAETPATRSSSSGPRRVRIWPVPAWAAAIASTVPIVMTTLACTLRRWVALQNTARSAVRSRVVVAEAGGEVDADGQEGEVDDAGGDEAETDRSRSPAAGPRARRTAMAKQASAATANGSASQPASEDSRIVVSIGVLWETPTATSRAPSGMRRRRAPGWPTARRFLHELARCRRRSRAGGCAGPRRSPSAARGRRRGTRPGRRRSPRGRRRSASTTGRAATVICGRGRPAARARRRSARRRPRGPPAP